MKLIGILGVSLAFLICACKNDSNVNSNPSNLSDTVNTTSENNTIANDSSKTGFASEFKTFYEALKNKDQKALNKYIDPNLGFVVIYSEGAMPSVASTDNLIDFTTNTGRVIHEFVSFPDLNLKEEALPKIDCNSKSFYTKTGSYFSTENPTLEQEMWIYGNFSDSEKETYKVAAQQLTYNVIVTGNARYGVKYSDQKLKVIFIDLRKPCNS